VSNKAVKELSWDPVRHGDIYCAPACGGKCTWAAYQEANKNAKALARKLGKGWVPLVWENLGWHWAAKTTDGLMKVHPGIYKGKVTDYTAYFGEGSSGQWIGQNKNPVVAVADALQKAQDNAAKIDKLVNTYRLTVSKD
jgi:hypothetical protein